MRAALLAVLNETVLVGGRQWPVLLGIGQSAASLAKALTQSDRTTLSVPESLPLDLESAADGTA